MRLSIITPYYNTLEYTLRLAEVLQPQLTDEVEWIIVDDGCNEKELDKLKATVIHQRENSGTASTPRNIGLDWATGEYIAFIDSDDLVTDNYVEKIMQKIKKKPDIIYLSWKSTKHNITINTRPSRWNCAVWCRVYKKETIGNVRFDERLRKAEDWVFNQQINPVKTTSIKNRYTYTLMVGKEVYAMAKYIIMCGGEYSEFETPKQLSVIKGERLVDRTIRLLKENGVTDIYISSNNPIFDTCNVPRLINEKNNWKYETNNKNYWLDAFYPVTEKVVYIWGDVYFTEDAIKTIVNYKTGKDVLFGTGIAMNKWHENWGEPFAYIVNNYKNFFKAIEEVKRLYDKGKVKRQPIVWELYRYLHGLDINIQQITEDYVCIDDGTIDIDHPEDIEELNRR